MKRWGLLAIVVATVVGHGWAQMVTGRVKSPLKAQIDYTMATPASAPTVATSGTFSANCLNSLSFTWYTAPVNEAGVGTLSPASIAWTPSSNAKKATITRVSAAASNEKGWLVYMTVNPAGCTGAGTPTACCTGVGTGCAETYLERANSSSGPTTLEDAFNTSATTSASFFCSTSSMTLASARGLGCTGAAAPLPCCTAVGTGTCTAGPRDETSQNKVGLGIIGVRTNAGGNINLLTEDVRRLDISGAVPRFSGDAGANYSSFIVKPVNLSLICPSGCDYVSLNAACAGITSSAAVPVTFLVMPGAYSYTTAQSCSGQISATIKGFGPESTIITRTTQTAGDYGTLELGTAKDITVEGLQLVGHRSVYADFASTGGGKVTFRDNIFLTNGTGNNQVDPDQDCLFLKNYISGSVVLMERNRCTSQADGFTNKAGGAGVTWISRDNTFTALDGGQSNSAFAFEAILTLFVSQGDSIDMTGVRVGRGYNWQGDGTGGCSSGCQGYVIGAKVAVNNTVGVGNSGLAYGVFVGTDATEVSRVDVIGSDVEVTTNDSSLGTTRGITVENGPTTTMNVLATRVRTSGGNANTDILSGSAGTVNCTGVDYVTKSGSGTNCTRDFGLLATAPGTCAIGDHYKDTSGADCVAATSCTWEKTNATGACT